MEGWGQIYHLPQHILVFKYPSRDRVKNPTILIKGAFVEKCKRFRFVEFSMRWIPTVILPETRFYKLRVKQQRNLSVHGFIIRYIRNFGTDDYA